MKSRIILQQGLMEGKVIKEESLSVGSSPASPAPAPQHPHQHTSGATTGTNTPAGTTPSTPGATAAGGSTAQPASGKENRRVGSPHTQASEILTRSRTKVLTKENFDPSAHSHRMSESPKGPGSVVGLVGGTPAGSQHSPSMPGIKSAAPGHHSTVSPGPGHGGGFGGHPFSSPHSTTTPTSAGSGAGGGTGRRSPSPSPPNAVPSAHNLSNNSSSTGRTPSSSSNNSSGSSNPIFGGGEGLIHGSSANGRYVVKIKRFLGTLLHFGCDISVEVGERVRNLVFNLVSGLLSIEEFHHSLQEVTSFPLRPFVLPFLRTHLPLLQREISHLARISKQSPLSFIRSHEQVILESGSSPGEPCDIFHSEASDMGLSGKRKFSESFYENGESHESGTYTSTPKRHRHGSLFSPFSSLGGGSGGPGVTGGDIRDYYSSGYPLLTPSSSAHHTHSHHHEPGTNGGGQSGTNNPITNGGNSTPSGPEDEWRNINVMLSCILQMVEKTKRALSILQNRTCQHSSSNGDLESSPTLSSSSSAAPMRLRRPNYSADNSDDFKRQAGEMMAQALRATEDRVAEVKRRAEEAVQEVKRQALVELQRAVAAAEARACEAVASERARLERAFLRTPAESMMVAAPVDPETCWNCGRKAHETCSGCNMARYCSSFCQYKDWEHHHNSCGRNSSSSGERDRERTPASSNSDSKSAQVQENSSNSSPINVGHHSPDNRSPRPNN